MVARQDNELKDISINLTLLAGLVLLSSRSMATSQFSILKSFMFSISQLSLLLAPLSLDDIVVFMSNDIRTCRKGMPSLRSPGTAATSYHAAVSPK